MKYSNIPSAQTVVHHCKAKGIQNIVISPGSRNAPLIIGFSEDPYFKCFSIVDERCAAFFALGIAQQISKPVVVVCTSGSALLNYYPAISEAFYSNIPLVVLSADRPHYKIDIGDGQTIRQDNVFDKHIEYSASLRQDVVHATKLIEKYRPNWLQGGNVEMIQGAIQNYNNRVLNEALNLATSLQAPVHINIPFEEPLYGTVTEASVSPYIETPRREENQTVSDLAYFSEKWNASNRKMILVGVNHPNRVEQQYLDDLATDPSVLVLTETTSNLHHPNFFPSIDSLVAPIEKLDHHAQHFANLRPDILLTFGGMIVSKKIKAFLREYQPKHHWHVGTHVANNTFFCLSHHFKINANKFFRIFLPLTKHVESNYFGHWSGIRTAIELKRAAYLKSIPFSDMLAFYHILKNIPLQYQLQLANSTTVRYGQLFDMDTSLEVYSNRGSSGIDGSTSTAIGAAMYANSPTVLVTGDLSFFYDSNALWNSHIRADFRIVLINNNGGGIFRILPGNEESDVFETFFETTHHLNAKALCEMYEIGYSKVDEELELSTVLPSFFASSNRPKLIEINTPRLMNNKILLTYFDFISSVFINH